MGREYLRGAAFLEGCFECVRPKGGLQWFCLYLIFMYINNVWCLQPCINKGDDNDNGFWYSDQGHSSLPHPLSLYPHPLAPNPTPLSLPLPYPSLVFFLTFLCSVPLSERLKQTNFSTFRFRHCTTTKWNFLTSNFKFYGKRRHQMKFLLFFPRTWMPFLRIQLQKYSPRFDKFSRSNVFTAMNFETAQIPFFTLTF